MPQEMLPEQSRKGGGGKEFNFYCYCKGEAEWFLVFCFFFGFLVVGL